LKSIIDKTNTLRRAVAASTIVAKPETIQRLVENDVPKKDILIVARVAGVTAAKKTPDLIPYCHPIPIDSVEIEYEVKKDRIEVTATVEAIWKTGVEMEALSAASASVLTIYDMLKPIDKDLEIVSTKLLAKTGGKTDRGEKIPKNFTAAVIVTSDGTSKGVREDKSGKVIQERLKNLGIPASYTILPDEKDEIVAKLKELCERKQLRKSLKEKFLGSWKRLAHSVRTVLLMPCFHEG